MKVKSKSLTTVCDPMDYTGLGILQARILEEVAFPFSSGSSQPRKIWGRPKLGTSALWVEKKV